MRTTAIDPINLAHRILLPALHHAASAVKLRRAALADAVEEAFTDLAWSGLEQAPSATVPAAATPSERPAVDVTGLYALICVVGALAQGLVS